MGQATPIFLPQSKCYTHTYAFDLITHVINEQYTQHQSYHV
jgi:hypothetical protein